MADLAFTHPPTTSSDRRKFGEWAYRVAHKAAKARGEADPHGAGVKAQQAKLEELKNRKWGPVEGPHSTIPDYPPDMARHGG